MTETKMSYEDFLELLDGPYTRCIDVLDGMVTRGQRTVVFDNFVAVLGANSEALNLRQKVATTMVINCLWGNWAHQFITADDAAKLVKAIDGAWTEGEHIRPVHLMKNTRDIICARFSLDITPVGA